jgi:hypothetical protein
VFLRYPNRRDSHEASRCYPGRRKRARCCGRISWLGACCLVSGA